MTDVSIEVSGEMETPSNIKNKGSITQSLLQIHTQLPVAKEWLITRKNHVRPWLQFVQTSNFKLPPNLPRLSRRIMRNIEYFQSNYLFVFLGLIVYCLVTSPLLLIAVVFSLYVSYRLSQRTEKVIVWGQELSLAQQYGCVALFSMPVFYLVGAGAAMFWVLGASISLITLHAALYNIDALISEEDDSFGLTQEV